MKKYNQITENKHGTEKNRLKSPSNDLTMNTICHQWSRNRRLTPKECFRMMGIVDADFEKLKGISDTQLYKLAGNSIVVSVLERIFRNLFSNQAVESCGINTLK